MRQLGQVAAGEHAVVVSSPSQSAITCASPFSVRGLLLQASSVLSSCDARLAFFGAAFPAREKPSKR